MTTQHVRPVLAPVMTAATRRLPMLAILAGAIAVAAIISVVIMLGLLPPDDLAVVGRLFTAQL